MRVASTSDPLHVQQPDRLRRHADIRGVFAARNRSRCPNVDVYVRRRGDDDPPRVAVVASRKVGSAVTRNRAKRRLRAAAAVAGIPAGIDVVLMARAETAGADFGELVGQLNSVRWLSGRDPR